MRRMLLLVLGLALTVGIIFVGVILALASPVVLLHELAALILLLLLGVGLVAAYRLRTLDRRPLTRVAVALAALVSAAIIGAELATSSVTGILASLPLVPLAVMLLSIADGIRVAWALPQ
jgi:hypothetical protein